MADGTFFSVGGIRLPLLVRAIRIGDRTFPLDLPDNTPENLEKVIQARGLREHTWPYWLEEWPTNYALAAYLDGCGADLAAPVLDLGSGAGFLPAFLRARFGHRVVACDFNFDACRLTHRNLARAGGAPVLCADFRHWPGRSRFPTIVVSELLYAAENVPKVLDFLEERLEPGGMAILADPERSTAARLEEEARARGFAVQRHKRPLGQAGAMVHVFQLRNGEAGGPAG